ncbi:NAD-dependent epimerase/dehydratase family protein [Niabella digestorum]|jgi:Nucleoside-diphosphate-sugar epimerases|uniref:NAD-dependent epimerase/dehydratase family protein n=1 Tax=Niabella digestorum TaxID=3117701 RepID=A0ABU7RFI7_9BACT
MGNILITGAAGFIGMHLVKKIVQTEHTLYGIDNLNDYYDVNLKKGRLKELGIGDPDSKIMLKSDLYSNFFFSKTDILDRSSLIDLFQTYKFDYVINLAAQAGVRYSLINPDTYVQSNVVGFYNILEVCRKYPVKHLLYASSSSVYGLNEKIPFKTTDYTDHPISLYAASKKSNEVMAYTYSHLFAIPCTGLRFFTVYGPWYRPDMAMFLFADAIFEGRPIKVFNNGQLKRDFTYIDDIVTAIEKLVAQPPFDGDETLNNPSNPYYRLLNIGNNSPVELLTMIEVLEEKLGKKAIKEFLPMQPGDVEVTYADVAPLQKLTGFKPATVLEKGIEQFATWYKNYYKK